MIEPPESSKRLAKQFVEAGSYIERNFQAYCDAMLESGWIPDMDFPIGLAAKLVERILKAEPEDTAGVIDKVMLDHYDAGYIEDSLLPRLERAGCLQERTMIVAKAVRAHCGGDYELSVPVLCAQIEGTVTGGRIEEKDPENKLPEILRDWLYLTVTKPMREAGIPEKEIEAIIDQTDVSDVNGRVESLQSEAVERFVKEQLYGKYTRDVPLNRNRVLHGLDVNYATEAVSLRAILLLKFVVACIEELNQRDETGGEEVRDG